MSYTVFWFSTEVNKPIRPALALPQLCLLAKALPLSYSDPLTFVARPVRLLANVKYVSKPV